MLRKSIALAVVLSGWTAWVVGGAELVLDFREARLNETPPGFRSILAGSGQPGDWRIVHDEVPYGLGSLTTGKREMARQPVLAQLSRDTTDERFPMLAYEDEVFGDFTLTTQFKLVDGKEERMAGIAFRIQDERNYYYIRASALGSTFYFFKIVDGQRSAPIGNKIEIPAGVWHEMTIECKGPRIRATLNGKEALPWMDDKSFTMGKIAFWTKSDSVSYFHGTVIDYKPRETLAQLLVKDAHKKYPRLQGLRIYAPKTNDGPMQVVASLDPGEVGQTAPKEAEEVLAKRGYFYGRNSSEVMLTLPLHDNNGEKVAAVRVVMKTFLGQTEKNALARAMPVVKGMETRIQTLKDLVQ